MKRLAENSSELEKLAVFYQRRGRAGGGCWQHIGHDVLAMGQLTKCTQRGQNRSGLSFCDRIENITSQCMSTIGLDLKAQVHIRLFANIYEDTKKFPQLDFNSAM